MTPVEVLDAARGLLTRSGGAGLHVWPRAGAFLARQALEAALADFWGQHPRMADLVDCPMATQLICLRTATDPDIAHRAAYTWAALSEACHYHPYELSPTAAELTGWFAAVDEVIGALAEV